MKKKVPAWLVLMVIASVAGLFLSTTYAITAPIIKVRALAEADVDRYAIFQNATSFRAMKLPDDAPVMNCYEALSQDTVIGHIAQISVTGYKGPIEIMLGLDSSNTVTGIRIGGASFAETAGLGARVKEPEFGAQFCGITIPANLGENIDGISGATISSGAVASGVNKIAKYINNLGKDPAEVDLYNNILSGETNYTELPVDNTVERAYQTDSSYIVYVTENGFHGEINTVVVLDKQGVVTRVAIDDVNFIETAGLGERVLEPTFLAQYIGKSGVIGVTPSGTEWSDGTSGATAQTDWTADAGNAPTAPAIVSASSCDDTKHKNDEDSEDDDQEDDDHKTNFDAASSATVEATASVTTTAGLPANAAGEVGSDATSSATTVVEVIEGADSMIDSVSGATISSTAVTKAVNAAIAFVRALLNA
ncbi:MAG: FMN-binding protein [Clostridia bacterium]